MVPFLNFHPWSQIQLLSFSPLLCTRCSVATPCSTLCDPMDYSEPGASVLRCLPKFAQIHFHWVGDAIQPSHPLLPSSLPALSLSQHQDLSGAKVLELQLQHESSLILQVKSINSGHSAFFMIKLTHSYMTIGKTIALAKDICWQSDVSVF